MAVVVKRVHCIIISKSIPWLRRRSRLQVILFLVLAAVEPNGLRNFGRGFPRNIPVKLFQNLYTSLAEVFFLLKTLAAILFNGEERFEQFW